MWYLLVSVPDHCLSSYFIMGKEEIGIYFCLTVDILTKVLQNCSLSSPLPTVCILSKPLTLLVANRKAKLKNVYTKIFFSEAIRGVKLKLCKNVHDTGLYIFFFYYRCSCAFLAFFYIIAEFDKSLFTLSPYITRGPMVLYRSPEC